MKNVTHSQNVTDLSFKFPNTTSSDRFIITVRAYGVAGLGHPLIINPDKWGILPHHVIGSAEQQNTIVYLDSFMIFVIIFISLALVVLIVAYLVCRRHHYCKNSNGIINSDQSSFPPTTSPLSENIRSEEMYEMQTLIPTSQLVMANGKDSFVSPSNGGVSLKENQKILRTSTPTEESIDQMRIELPPIKYDDGLMTRDSEERNDLLDALNLKQHSSANTKANGTLKTKDNSNHFKSLQVSTSILSKIANR